MRSPSEWVIPFFYDDLKDDIPLSLCLYLEIVFMLFRWNKSNCLCFRPLPWLTAHWCGHHVGNHRSETVITIKFD